jgi:hypothetical protein
MRRHTCTLGLVPSRNPRHCSSLDVEVRSRGTCEGYAQVLKSHGKRVVAPSPVQFESLKEYREGSVTHAIFVIVVQRHVQMRRSVELENLSAVISRVVTTPRTESNLSVCGVGSPWIV